RIRLKPDPSSTIRLKPDPTTALSILPDVNRRLNEGKIIRFGSSWTLFQEDKTMRFMVIVKANKESEAGVMPSQKVLSDMGKYNEQLVKAGVILAGEGLHPS